MLENSWNIRLPYDNIKKHIVDIHQTERGFNIILDKERHHSNRCMQASFIYAKERWEKSHKLPYFKVGDLVLVSTLKFTSIKGSKKLPFRYFYNKSTTWP
ncbi:hypothetical protein O181_062341 [Austropuccinia psidii MF-1]|uniref:Uncharacterized protein n=1 Tax=Austropuccinia psidii MF-1 TaxID=1389203 RepID=A0A9Q3HYC5_9BASI|nr:hypothetical protein [Austropuccinia psidii MF-1]